jgi:predicted amidohydrolase/ribosomal protein S18 acetylase RimI-like enzyme
MTTDTSHTEPQIILRKLRAKDYLDLKASMVEAYDGTDTSPWRKQDIERLVTLFPEGQLCIEVEGQVVATALAIIVDYGKLGDAHTFRQATDNFNFTTHDPDGDVLYGIEVFVHPAHRGLRLARRLYDARKELCENLNLRAIIAGGRIPNYSEYASELSPREYIDKVRQREIYDPTLTFQLANDFHAIKVLRGYDPEDTDSCSYATLLEWDNIYYEKHEKLVGGTKESVRIGLVQWQMRQLASLEALIEQMEYFVDAVSDYGSDFCLFPEWFNAPLMAKFNDLREVEAVRKLAEYTEPLREKMVEFAISYNVNIVAGSMPLVEEDGSLKNVSYLCRRDGSWDSTMKIHPTPDEVRVWGMTGGDKIQTFDTDSGRIGILICYDVEFPELARLLAEEQMQILFVPFQTDTQTGFNRVKICAQARAIENECYVVMAGNVGNLPRVHNMDIQYAQSAIFTPSDFAFPVDTVRAEATPNTEMTLIADVNLKLLKELHNHGSVQNLKDRRTDLYQLQRCDRQRR